MTAHMPPTLRGAQPALVDTHEPVRPASYLTAPTPVAQVAALAPEQRVERVWDLITQANRIVRDAIAEHLDGHDLAGVVLLFSGGNDSTTLAHLFRDQATHAAHANTGIGIEETRQFVRDTCASWGLPLIEKHPPESYRDLLLEMVTDKKTQVTAPRGFPGPAMHFMMFTRLKERCLDQVRRDLVMDGRKQRVVFIAGRRREESARRARTVRLHERDKSVIWVSPLANWTRLDLNTYRQMFDVLRNPVTDKLHMSGECLCGAFAKPGELEEIRFWYPEVAAEIDALAEEVRAAGVPEPLCQWGHGKGKPSNRVGMLCSSCAAPQDILPIRGAA